MVFLQPWRRSWALTLPHFDLLYVLVHSVLPLVFLGIGVNDVFVIANAFERERAIWDEGYDKHST